MLRLLLLGVFGLGSFIGGVVFETRFKEWKRDKGLSTEKEVPIATKIGQTSNGQSIHTMKVNGGELYVVDGVGVTFVAAK